MSLCCDGVRQEGTRRAGFSDRRDAVQTPLMFEIFQTTLLSTGVVAAAEIGDKTMLLAVFLAARFRKPWTIILGIFVATFLNHVIAGALGATLANFISADLLRWILIVSFIAMGIWILIPDKIDEGGNDDRLRRFGVFGTTVILFFIAEVGDKTQVATVALAARYPAEAFWVVCGSFHRQQTRRKDFDEADAPDCGCSLFHPCCCCIFGSLSSPITEVTGF